MKKLLLCLTAILMLSSCSGDEASSTADLQSSLLVNGASFIPGSINHQLFPPLTTTLETGVNNGASHNRIFHLVKIASLDNLQAVTGIQVVITYPASQASVTGTYSFSESADTAAAYAEGAYADGLRLDAFKSGLVTVTDLGNDRFKLVFTNVVTLLNQTTIIGSFEGTFEEDTDF